MSSSSHEEESLATSRLKRGRRVRVRASFGVVLVGVALGSSAGGAGASGGAEAPEAVVILATTSGSRVAAVTLDGGRGKIARLYSHAGGRMLSLSPDGRRAAIVTAGSNLRNELEILDLTSGRSRVLATAREIVGGAGFFGTAAWAPGMEVIAVTHGIGLDRSAIQLLDAQTGRRVRRSLGVSAHLDSRLAWTADGRSLIFAYVRGTRQTPQLRRLDVATGRTVALRRAGLDPTYGRRGELAFAASDGIRILRNGRVARVPASVQGDRIPAWIDESTLLVERPIGGCPRDFVMRVCSRIRVLRLGGGPAPRLFDRRARNPATRPSD